MALTLCDSAHWEEIEKQEGYFSRLIDNDFVVVTYFNGNACKDCQKQALSALKELEENEFVKENSVHLLYIDMIKTPFFQKHYDLEEHQYMYLFVRNQIQKFENFEELIGSEKLYESTLTFIKDIVENVVVEVQNLEEVKDLAEQNGIIGVYMGKKDKSYQRFYDLAIRNYAFKFYQTFDANLQADIQKNYQKKTSEKNQFVIIRGSTQINEFDKQPLVSFEDFHSEFHLKKFFEFERYPKMRDCTWNKLNVEEIFFKRHFLMIYITPKVEDGESNWNFDRAIEYLPKRMIYSKCSVESDHINHYLHLFMLAGSSFQPGGVYILNVAPTQKVKVEHFNQKLTKDNLVNWTFTIYDRNKYFFNDPLEEEHREKFYTEEFQLLLININLLIITQRIHTEFLQIRIINFTNKKSNNQAYDDDIQYQGNKETIFHQLKYNLSYPKVTNKQKNHIQ